MTAWPDILPASPLIDGFREIPATTTVRTSMDQGPAKVRQVTTAGVAALSLSYLLNGAETAALDEFFNDTTAGGALRFDFTHPRSGAPLVCRFKQPPQYGAVNGGYFKAVIELEVMV